MSASEAVAYFRSPQDDSCALEPCIVNAQPVDDLQCHLSASTAAKLLMSLTPPRWYAVRAGSRARVPYSFVTWPGGTEECFASNATELSGLRQQQFRTPKQNLPEKRDLNIYG